MSKTPRTETALNSDFPISCLHVECIKIEEELATVTAERDALRAIFPRILEALANGSWCASDASLDFLQHIPSDVAAAVKRMTAERDALRAALHDMISVAQSQGWDNAELHNAIDAAMEGGQ